ncbi:hypothetical protein BV898_12872 [Hypsibius exemplaris]|uniref:Uncharacterized protein n=1 Tax=Hypsibius exemplaris TaxID=2072580 RepID=A0A1W0WCB8_HYPEX|nr:hypothetical protein BV898_12872 [Hypsibius exemplaris]
MLCEILKRSQLSGGQLQILKGSEAARTRLRFLTVEEIVNGPLEGGLLTGVEYPDLMRQNFLKSTSSPAVTPFLHLYPTEPRVL